MICDALLVLLNPIVLVIEALMPLFGQLPVKVNLDGLLVDSLEILLEHFLVPLNLLELVVESPAPLLRHMGQDVVLCLFVPVEVPELVLEA